MSDWFPTLVGLSGYKYAPSVGYELDGFDHSDALLAVTNRRQRRLDYSSSSDSNSIINSNQHVDSRYSDSSSSSASRSGDTSLGSGSVDSGISTTDSEMQITFPTTSVVGPREYLLYNFYYNPDDGETVADSFYGSGIRILIIIIIIIMGMSHILSTHPLTPPSQQTPSHHPLTPSIYHHTVPGAIRNSKYKLLHTYDSGLAGSWYTATEVFLNDDDLSMFGTCTQSQVQQDDTHNEPTPNA